LFYGEDVADGGVYPVVCVFTNHHQLCSSSHSLARSPSYRFVILVLPAIFIK
jgi:hypothetical protein